MNELALFAGAGGGILGGKLLGWNTIGAVEIEEYPRKVLLQRQRDGILKPFPIWDDIKTFNGRPWKGCVDIVSGGFPCQDISAAGKGAGIEGERSGLWGEFARVIDEIRPRFAFVENSPMLTIRGLGRVLGDLSEMGYNARWCVLGADDIGAPHRRKRIWILGYTSMYGLTASEKRKSIDERSNYSQTWEIETGKSKGSGSPRTNEKMAYTNDQGLQRTNVREAEHGTEKGLSSECRKITYWDTDPADISYTGCEHGREGNTTGMETNPEKRTSCTVHNKPSSKRQRENRSAQPIMGRVADGVAHRVDRLKAIGNGQVPAVAAIAFIILSEGLLNEIMQL